MIGALQTILRVFIVEKKLKMWCQSNMNMTIGWFVLGEPERAV